MNEPTAISGTRRAMKEMADGTIRVQIDIDPACRASFLGLFPNIDMPVALAPLVADFQEKAPNPKGGKASQWLAMRCQDPVFWAFLESEHGLSIETESDAADAVRSLLGVDSRAQVDSAPDALGRFHEMIREPWIAYLSEHA